MPYQSWQHIIAALLLAHMGKHTPTLAIQSNQVPLSVVEYLMALKPDLTEPPMPPFINGYVIGNYRDITFETQIQLEEYLTLMTKSMGGIME